MAAYPADVQVAAGERQPVHDRTRKRRATPRSATPASPPSARRRAATATCAKLLWIAAKGLGAGPNPNGPNPFTNDDNAIAQATCRRSSRGRRRARLPRPPASAR